MEIHFLLMEKSWKIIVEKEWLPWYKDGTGLLLRVGQRASHRTDAALFEEVLWQPMAEEAETELAEPNAGDMAVVKDG